MARRESPTPEAILSAVVRERPAALVVDSIQTVFLEDATGSPGSVSQVRECATALLHAAKTAGMPVFIIGHVTKSGDIAGPRVLEHIVDVVLYLEGDADRAVRVLRVGTVAHCLLSFNPSFVFERFEPCSTRRCIVFLPSLH